MASRAAPDLNEDLAAYVQTFPAPERLREHLTAQGRLGVLASVQETLDLAVADAGDFLYMHPSPVPGFEQALYRYLSERHAWLTQKGLDTLKIYAGWLSWHEGLDAQ